MPIRPLAELTGRHAVDPIAIGVIATPGARRPGRVRRPRRRRHQLDPQLRPRRARPCRAAWTYAVSTSRRSCRSSPSTPSASPSPRATSGRRWRPSEPARHRTVPPHGTPVGARGAVRAPDRAEAIAASVLGSATATEAVVLSTCNRLEVYASVPAFHPAVAAIGEALALAAGIEEPTDPSGRRSAPGAPADALPPVPRRSPTTSTSATTTRPSPTPSPWPAGSTRWPSVRPRSSARCATRSPGPRAGVRWGSRSTRSSRGPPGRQARPRRDRHRPAQRLARADRSRGGGLRPRTARRRLHRGGRSRGDELAWPPRPPAARASSPSPSSTAPPSAPSASPPRRPEWPGRGPSCPTCSLRATS